MQTTVINIHTLPLARHILIEINRKQTVHITQSLANRANNQTKRVLIHSDCRKGFFYMRKTPQNIFLNTCKFKKCQQ